MTEAGGRGQTRVASPVVAAPVGSRYTSLVISAEIHREPASITAHSWISKPARENNSTVWGCRHPVRSRHHGTRPRIHWRSSSIPEGAVICTNVYAEENMQTEMSAMWKVTSHLFSVHLPSGCQPVHYCSPVSQSLSEPANFLFPWPQKQLSGSICPMLWKQTTY